MKFNQPCFIRKNTPELIEYLQIIGYRTLHKKHLEGSEGLFVQPPNWYGGFIDINWSYEEIEDCGTNEELFKAIAALSDGVSEGQYIKADADFTVYWGDQAGNDFSRHLKKDEVFTADRVFLCSECFDRDAWHTMSVQELIEYFKNK